MKIFIYFFYYTDKYPSQWRFTFDDTPIENIGLEAADLTLALQSATLERTTGRLGRILRVNKAVALTITEASTTNCYR